MRSHPPGRGSSIVDADAEAGLYEIRIRGVLSDRLLRAFPDLEAKTRDGQTVLVGALPDQASLYGVLGQIEALGLKLLEVRYGPPGPEGPGGAGRHAPTGPDSPEREQAMTNKGTRIAPSLPGGAGQRLIRELGGRANACGCSAPGGWGGLAYTGREGPAVLPIVYKLHEGSIVFHPLQGTFTEQDLRTGIAHADYKVAFEIDQIDPDARGGWAVLVVGSAPPCR